MATRSSGRAPDPEYRPRVPIRPESPSQEIARYPGRLKEWERKHALSDGYYESEQAQTHRRGNPWTKTSPCENRMCQHQAHIRPVGSGSATCSCTAPT